MAVAAGGTPSAAGGRASRVAVSDCQRGWLARAAPRRRGLPLAAPRPHLPAMTFPAMPDPAAERERDEARRHPERETLLLAAAGAVQVLGVDHGVTKARA